MATQVCGGAGGNKGRPREGCSCAPHYTSATLPGFVYDCPTDVLQGQQPALCFAWKSFMTQFPTPPRREGASVSLPPVRQRAGRARRTLPGGAAPGAGGGGGHCARGGTARHRGPDRICRLESRCRPAAQRQDPGGDALPTPSAARWQPCRWEAVVSRDGWEGDRKAGRILGLGPVGLGRGACSCELHKLLTWMLNSYSGR